MDVPDIDVDELEGELRDGVNLIDVREPDEFADARIPGAVNIPMGSIPERVDELDPGSRLYVVCAGGNRSMRVVQFLVEQGIDAVNVNGGTAAWIESGRAHERD